MLAFFAGSFHATKKNVNTNISTNNNTQCDKIIEEKKCDCDKVCDELLKQVLSNKISNTTVQDPEIMQIDRTHDIKQLRQELDDKTIEEISDDDFIIIDENGNSDNIENTRNVDIRELDVSGTNNSNTINPTEITNVDNTVNDINITNEVENVEDIIDITNTEELITIDNNDNNVIVPSLEEEMDEEKDVFEEVVIEENVQQ